MESLLKLLTFLGRLSKEQAQKLEEEYYFLLQQGFPISWQSFLCEQKLLSKEEYQQLELLLRTGFYMCENCKSRFSFSLSRHLPSHCPKCQGQLTLFWKPARKGISHYSIQGILGQGGYGTVYRVKDTTTGRFLALKILHSKNPKVQRRFLREIMIASRLSHPNIMPVYESGYIQGYPYFVMKEIQGTTWKEWMQQHREEPSFLRQSLRIFLKVCEAMEYAHAQGVVHRDLKPSNVAISEFAEVLVLDWGIAQAKGIQEVEETSLGKITQEDITLTQQGVIGTPGYMPPEQARGEKADERSDIYSLGAILYEILTGHPPFTGSPEERLTKTLLSSPPPPEALVPSTPRELSAIAMKCLHPLPGRRYQKVKELREDIELYLEGRSVKAKQDSLWEKTWKFCRRNQKVILPSFFLFAFFLTLWTANKIKTEWEKTSKVESYLKQVEKLLKSPLFSLPSQLKKEYASFYESFQKEPKEALSKRHTSMEICLQALSLLEKAKGLGKKRKKVKEKIFYVRKLLGELALLGGDEFLAYVSFAECAKLFPQKGKKLLHSLKQWKKKREAQKVKILFQILEKLEKQPAEGEVEELALSLIQWKNQEVVRELLRRLHKGELNKWQRRFAIMALGRLGETQVRYQGKDPVEWLMEWLKQATSKDPKEWDTEEVTEIIWALGRLEDPRPISLVAKVRKKSGYYELLWNRTALPFQWLLQAALSKFHKKDPQKLLEIGRLLGEARQHKEAEKFLKRVLQIGSLKEVAEAHIHLGRIYAESKRKHLAIHHLQEALRLNPDKGSIYSNIGSLYAELGEYKKALRWYRLAQTKKLLPEERFYLFYNIGQTYTFMGKAEKALEYYLKALKLRPKSANTYRALGNLFWQRFRRPSLAISYFQKAIQFNPKDSLTYFSLGRLYLELKKYDQALEYLQHAIRLNSQIEEFHFSLAAVYIELKKYELALETLTNLASWHPCQRVYKTLGDLYLSHFNNATKAIECYKKILPLSPSDPTLYNRLGCAYSKLKKYELAVEYHTKAIQFDPDQMLHYLNRGRIYLKLKQWDRAAKDFQTILQSSLPPDSYVRKEAEKELKKIKRKGVK